MLSGLSSYLFGGPSEEGHPAATTQSATELAAKAAAAAAATATAATTTKRPARLRTTTTDDDWTIVDPESRGNSPQRLENNPMENLLIEHPSMSVYEQRGRPNSRGTESSGESDTDMDTVTTQPSRSQALSRQAAGSNRSVRLAAGLSAAVAMKANKSAQVAHKRKEARKVSRAQLERTNKVQKFNSMGKVPRRKQQMCRLNSGRNNDRKCHY